MEIGRENVSTVPSMQMTRDTLWLEILPSVHWLRWTERGVMYRTIMLLRSIITRNVLEYSR